MTCQLVCGYLIFLLSHAFSGDHYDVVYVPSGMARNSSYCITLEQCKHEIANVQSFEAFSLFLFQLTATQDKILIVHDDNTTPDIADRFVFFFFFFFKKKKKKKKTELMDKQEVSTTTTTTTTKIE
ncbi:hypothetical protein RFI_08915 [Reticulomyxa filosa]|uniref:Secreted protein n=1 Tax=Reticulomyxa filosa TaxID=46433 RepID=X6NQM3_RETFI|nr:hypothetical protein RFI_08915 [Reticulomyxa filosa]|eukprot:ETO28218.1 hypothetical protein RFI_08915 [Reticulomyxa filosa]